MTRNARAGREGIEPPLRILEIRLVTMALRPKETATRDAKSFIARQSGHASIRAFESLRRLELAETFGFEPMYSSLHSPSVTDGDRTRLRRVTACPRHQTSTVTTSHYETRCTMFRAARAPAEGIEPPNLRLTVGCLTIRLRWKKSLFRTTK